MAQDPEVRKQLRDLGDRMEELQSVIAKVAAPYAELTEYLQRFQQIAGKYFQLVDIYQRHGAISPELVVPGLKDPISRDIVRLLFEQGERNISQIADALKDFRGKSSRRIVREKLGELEKRGVVVRGTDARWPTYRIAEDVERKWAELLGLPARPGDRPALATKDRSP